jgi:phosphoribosylaminoimidazole-succinocarboxamide synthase
MPADPPVLTATQLAGVPMFKSGKVRDVYDLGESLLVVATDRISAFDSVLPTGIPMKGMVLNQLSAWWFERTRHITPNHLLTADADRFPASLQPYREQLAGRSMQVVKAEALPVECVVRGYLIGSGWNEYTRSGTVSGLPLRPGYRLADRLDEPIFTPSTKAESGHDENISFEQVAARVGPELAGRLREVSLALYRFAADHARGRGLIIADTKFEFGLRDGRLLLIDEALTPDSSRFWAADSYRPGRSPPSYDKQFVRDYLESIGWNKEPPAPPLPDSIADRTREKYVEAYRLLTGQELAAG